MSFFVPSFRGLVEVVAPQRLEDNQATDALNCRIESGDLVPYLIPAFECDTGAVASGTPSIFKYSAARWVRWNTAVNAVRMPATDAYNRLYYTGDGYPKVTDTNVIGATNGGAVAAHRRVGIPAPYNLYAQVTGNTGVGTISSIYFWVNRLTSQSKAVVTTSAAHGLSNEHTVVLNFPGVPAGQVYRVQVLSATTFTPVGLKLKQATVVRGLREASADVTIRAPGHGFNTGDKVRLKAAFTGDLAGYGNGATTYTIEVVDGNKFTLVNTSGSAISAQDVEGDCVQVVDITNPLQYNGSDPVATWVAPEWQVVTNGVYADGRTLNTWYRTDVATQLQSRYYCVTFVNGYGQEGPPSAPVLIDDINPNGSVVYVTWQSGDGVNCGQRGDQTLVLGTDLKSTTGWWVTHARVYRTDTTGQWRYVGQQAITSDIFQDSLPDTSLGEVLSTTGYIDPPDALTGLTTTPFGVFMGYVGKEVYASVPYQPHAWPLAYRVKSDYDIKGLVVTGAGVIVLTDGYPSLLIGLDPASWQLVKLEIPQACVSSRSVVDMGEWGLFASPDGLVAIQQNDAKVVTQTVFNRVQWQTRTPTAVFGAFYEGKYFGVGSTGPFLFDPGTGDFVRLDFGYAVAALYTDLTTDTLYFLATDGRIYAFDRGASNLSMRWVSKTFQAPRPVALTAGQVVANGMVFATYYADGVAIHTQTVTDSRPFRLPRGRALDWQVDITGTQRVRQVAGAMSVAELRQV